MLTSRVVGRAGQVSWELEETAVERAAWDVLLKSNVPADCGRTDTSRRDGGLKAGVSAAAAQGDRATGRKVNQDAASGRRGYHDAKRQARQSRSTSVSAYCTVL